MGKGVLRPLVGDQWIHASKAWASISEPLGMSPYAGFEC
jgi:hypothetical protein